jgi:hypothetical protein
MEEWQYSHSVDIDKRTRHVWNRPSYMDETDVEWCMTDQPANGLGIDFIKPRKTYGHWTSTDAFNKHLKNIGYENLMVKNEI